MTALKKIEFTEVSEVSIFDGAHTGLISSTCIQWELPSFGASEKGLSCDKSPKKHRYFQRPGDGFGFFDLLRLPMPDK